VNLGLILESLKFYKLKNARSIQIWFVLLYALNIVVYVVAAGNASITQYLDKLSGLLSNSTFSLADLATLTPPPAIWMVIGLTLLISLINGFFSLIYATLYVGELSGMTAGQSVRRCLAALPKLILFGLMIAVPAILSSCLAFLPLIFFGIMMYFLPLQMTLEKASLAEAVQGSASVTHGRRLFIFAQVFLIALLTSLPQNLILGFLPAGILPQGFITAFFMVLRALIMGRMMGMLYLVIVKQATIIVSHKTDSGE
jgi:hypothetical protein